MIDDMVVVCISDIHFGAFDSEILYTELKDEFLNKIKQLQEIDLIVVCGDLYDAKLSLNSNHARMSIVFMKELAKICLEKNCKLRIIKGTHSHDNNQLDMVSLYMKDLDYKLYNGVAIEELENGARILFLPEEYVDNVEEYYKEYLNDDVEPYDFIFGHGLIDTVSFISMVQESEGTMSKAPIFKSDNLLKVCSGPIVFGHIHKFQHIKKRIVYTGSFSRWCHGEEEEKGFVILRHNIKNYDLNFDFIINTLARTYKTVELTYTKDIADKEVVQQFQYILDILNSCKSDFIRLKLILPTFIENAHLITQVLTEMFAKYKKINLMIVNLSKLTKEEQNKEKVNILLDKYKFLFENNIPFSEKISNFIKLKYDKNITIEDIERYINK